MFFVFLPSFFFKIIIVSPVIINHFELGFWEFAVVTNLFLNTLISLLSESIRKRKSVLYTILISLWLLDSYFCFCLGIHYNTTNEKKMPSVSFAKLSPRIPRMIISTENGTLKLKKIAAHRVDSSLANSRYTRKQMKRKRQRKFGAVLRVPDFYFFLSGFFLHCAIPVFLVFHIEIIVELL